MNKSNRSCIIVFFIERGDNFDWEELLDQEAVKRRIAVNELDPGMNQIH